MNEEPKIKCKEYEIALTNKETGEKATVTLVRDIEKWKVVTEGYHGYFKDLEAAFNEACHHIKTKETK